MVSINNEIFIFSSVMNLPEIRLHVGRYLDMHDLASCALVNKTWHETFLPYLYYKCDTDISFCHPQHWPSFQNNLHHTRVFNILYNTIKNSNEKALVLQKCTLLRQLSLHPAHSNMTFFLQLLQQNHRLRRVDLSIGEVTELYLPTPLTIRPTSCAVTFLSTIAQSCPRLTELGLDMMLHPESEKQFFEIFSRHFMPRLNKLNWAWFRVSRVERSAWMIRENSLTEENRCDIKHTFPELKELTVYICILDMPHPWEEEVMLFENSPNLEVLSWSWDPSPLFGVGTYDPSWNINLFINILCKFITTRWFKLHSISLSISKCDTHVFQDEQISRVLKSLRNPLRRFELKNGNPCTKLTWQSLRQHLQTIKKLYLCTETGMALSSTQIEEVLTTGHHLVNFRHESVLKASDITIDMKIDVPYSSSIQFQYPWVCHRLQVLRIILLRNTEDHSLNLSIFNQLAKMTELRELHISSARRGPEYGLNPEDYLPDLTLAESFDGLYSSYKQIRNHPVGKRLLLIWPGLSNCYLYNL